MANVHSDFRMAFDLVSSSALKKNREDIHCISRSEGIWLHSWTQRVLINSTNFNGNHLLAASLRDPHWDEHFIVFIKQPG